MQSLANYRGPRAQVFQYIMQSLANYRAMHMRIKALEVDPRGAGFALQVPPAPARPASRPPTAETAGALCVGQRKPAPHTRWSGRSQRGRPWAKLLCAVAKPSGQHCLSTRHPAGSRQPSPLYDTLDVEATRP